MESQFLPVRDSQLVEDVMQAAVDRQFGDNAFVADLFVPITLRHQLHDRFFAIVKRRLIPGRPFV